MEQTREDANELEVRHEEQDGEGSFFVEPDRERLGELTYSRASPDTVVLEHTEVSPRLQGRGVGRVLVEAAVAWARRTGTKIVPMCPYAKSVIARTPAMRDVLR
jgi:predicted GNAT family acetyltransferase